jgi:hypothetical protein
MSRAFVKEDGDSWADASGRYERLLELAELFLGP